MAEADMKDAGHGGTEFVGAGQTVNDAVLDAILAANLQSNDSFGTQAEVVAWGVSAIGIGGACSFWVRIKKAQLPAPTKPEQPAAGAA